MKVKYKISDIFDLQMGKTPSRDEQSFWNSNDYKWIAISDLDDCKYIENTSEYISSQAVKNTGIKIVPKNTVIMSFKLSIGKVAITKEDMYTNEAIMAFFNKGIVNLELSYLYYLLKSYKWDLLAQRAAKGKSLNKEILNNATLCFHSNIQTQKEIVAVLDKVTSLIKMRNKQLEKLDILVKSKFIEMFGDPVLNPKGWEKKKWNDVFITTTGKRNSNEMVEFGQYPFFTCAKQIYYIDNYSFDCEALLLAGNNATADYDVKYYCGKFDAYQRTYVLTLKQNNSYKYFQYLLESKLSMMKNLSIGINTKYLTLKILNSIDFIIPPLDLQNQFAEFVEQVEKNKEKIKSSLNQLETLYNALMQEYFG